MFNTYEEYVTMPQAIPIEKMASIHRQIAEEIGNDPDAIDLYGELIAAAIKYAAVWAKWSVMSWEKDGKGSKQSRIYKDSMGNRIYS